MLRLIVAAVLLTGIAVGCKGDGSDSNASAPVSDDEFRWMATQAVNAALLTEDDLPANFELIPSSGDEDDDDPPIELTGECAEFNDLINADGDFLAAVAQAETDDFEDENEDSFSSNAGAFRDSGAAEAEAGTYQRFVSSETCLGQFKAAFRAYADDIAAGEGLTISEWLFDIEEITVPELGDWAHGIRMSVTFEFSDGRGVSYVVDSVSVRAGRMVGTVDYTYSDVADFVLRDAVVGKIAARLEAENEKLPG
jgi:hypothetical protein